MSVKLPLTGTGNIAGGAEVLFDSLGPGLAKGRITLLLGWCIPTLAGHLLQVTFGIIVSFKLPIARAGNTTWFAKGFFGGLDVGLRGALILPDLFFDGGSHSLELLGGEVENSADHAVCQGAVTTKAMIREQGSIPGTTVFHSIVSGIGNHCPEQEAECSFQCSEQNAESWYICS